MKHGFQKISQYGKSWAVVIGINSYANPDETPLDNAVNDAKVLGNLLRDIGFEVIELYNEGATRENILSLIADDLTNRVEAIDRVLIFFAGHAITKK